MDINGDFPPTQLFNHQPPMRSTKISVSVDFFAAACWSSLCLLLCDQLAKFLPAMHVIFSAWAKTKGRGYLKIFFWMCADQIDSVIDLKVLVRSFNCESRACYVGNPRESFFSSLAKVKFDFAKVSRKFRGKFGIIIIVCKGLPPMPPGVRQEKGTRECE